MFGDKNRFQRVLLNFLSNAIKFSEVDSKVKVIVEVRSIAQCMNANSFNKGTFDKGSEELPRVKSHADTIVTRER